MARPEVITPVLLKIQIFWDVSLLRCARGTTMLRNVRNYLPYKDLNSHARPEASAAVQLNSLVFWVITQREVV
jgi:hypothetical protein